MPVLHCCCIICQSFRAIHYLLGDPDLPDRAKCRIIAAVAHADLEIIGLSKRDKKKIIKDIFEHNDIIMKKIGYKLPRRWVEIENVDKVQYINPKCFNKGKKYRNISAFYEKNHRLPRPVIVDRNYNLLEGYNLILFAKEMNISEIPMVILENVEVEG